MLVGRFMGRGLQLAGVIWASFRVQSLRRVLKVKAARDGLGDVGAAV